MLLIVSTAACSATVQADDPPARAVAAFYAALGAGDMGAACALLAAPTRASLEQSSEQPCEKALQDEDLPQAQVLRVQVYGQTAFAELSRDTAFLGHSRSGWQVLAAGCRERSERPYDCQLEAG
jgi:hypothetical protein